VTPVVVARHGRAGWFQSIVRNRCRDPLINACLRCRMRHPPASVSVLHQANTAPTLSLSPAKFETPLPFPALFLIQGSELNVSSLIL
jgi:hypothetical protein